MRKFLIAGNWKMNGGIREADNLLRAIKERRTTVPQDIEVLVCPPFTSLSLADEILQGSEIKLGAQNVYFEDNGAYTGEISVQMLTEVGCTYVIAGHSERREHFGETDAIVNAKVKKALSAGLHPIVCVGETLEQRENDEHEAVVKQQVDLALNDIDEEAARDIVFAYEPIWAIGTGETASPDQADEMHAVIRENIALYYTEQTANDMRILYGGSMKPGNAQGLLQQSDIDGGLIGGASLKAESFNEIIDIGLNLSLKTG
jgi:triosephosphate isomerase